MFLFWSTILSIIIALSYLLAKRSMKSNSTQLKPADIPQALFLVRNPELITTALLEKLHPWLLAQGASLSFERLYKGPEEALVIYGPTTLPTEFPDLGLLELEDYLIPKDETQNAEKNGSKINADQVFGTQINLKSEMYALGSLPNPGLAEDEQFFYQLILQPVADKKELENQFKLTLRAMVATNQKDQKVKLAKKALGEVNSNLGLSIEDLHVTPNIFEKYRLRIAEGEKVFNPSQSLKFLSL